MPRSQPASEDHWPLLGRDRDMAAVLSAYRRMAASGGVTGVVLLGAAGVGKTRLAREAVARLAAAGSATTWATATRSAATVPLGALAHLLAPVDRPGPASVDALAALVARFTGNAGPPPVVAIDDAHLLDDASAALVHHLGISGRAFVLLTARTDEPAPDAATALWADGRAERIDVSPLADAAVATVLAHALDAPLDPIGVRELCRICAGNLMLLREVLVAGRATGALRRAGGAWRWTGDRYVTERLADVVRDHLGGLAAGVCAVVEPLAYAESLSVPMLEALCDRDALTLAEQRGLVVIENAGSRMVARLAHPVFAEVIRAGIARYREAQLARRLAAAIESTPMRRRDDHLHAARWRLRAGLPARPEQALFAVERARDRGELRLAEELAGAARRAGAGWPADLALAEVLLARGQYAQAAAALPPPAEDGDHDTRVRWRIADGQIRYWTGGGVDPHVDRIAAEEDAARSWLLLLDGQGAAGVRIASALEPARLPPDAACRAASATVFGRGLLGHDGQAVAAALRRGLAVAEGHREAYPWGTTQVSAAGCLGLLACGRLAEAAELAEHGYREALELTARLGDQAGLVVGVWAAVRGAVARNQGVARAALTALREAAVLLAEWPAFRLARVYLAHQAAASAVAGDTAAAAEGLRRADEAGSPGRLFDALVERDRAWVVAASGDLGAAADHAGRAAELARRTGQPAIEALAHYDVVRLGAAARAGADAEEACGRLAELAAATGDGIVPTFSAAAAALASGDSAATLDRVGAALAGTGHLIYAAEVAVAAHHRHAEAGRRVRAQASLGRATELLHRCGAVHTHLLDLTGAQNSLTARERHVASLAAAGQSGPTIAAKLGLSVRTVNNHLGRVYAKLGVGGRTELAAMITSLSPGSTPR